MNKNTDFASEYHEATKHSEISLMTQRHYLDFHNRPIPFKIYISNFPIYRLPSNFPQPTLDAIKSISMTGLEFDTESDYPAKNSDLRYGRKLGVEDIATILFFSAGITRATKYGSTTYYMRAASATGALYPIELYLICRDLDPDIEAGVYHFNPAEFSLTQIRKGDYRRYLAAALAEQVTTLSSPVSLIFTSLAWRNSWKYQARSYRHWFWDSGVMVANLLATTAAMGLRTILKMGFIDNAVDRLLALESHREATVIIGNINEVKDEKEPSQEMVNKEILREISEIDNPKIRPLSEKEVSYPQIWTLHDASSLYTEEETRAWKNGIDYDLSAEKNIQYTSSEAPGVLNRIPISSLQHQSNLQNNIPGLSEVILRRGSTRRFTNSPISFSTLSTILDSSTKSIPLDFLKLTDFSLIDIYLICNNIEKLPSGGYFFNRKLKSIDLLKLKVSREMSGYLCLAQSLFSQASAVLFLMTDLRRVLEALGNRGYRAAQLEAGIIAGKIYLAAYAQGIGASGSTFFDDAVTEFFSPHAERKSTMIVVGIGKPAYKARSGGILPVRLTREQLLEMMF